MKKQKDSAGGWGALHSSNHFLFRERITTKALALYKMNKPGGFDCPGCAWGDPDEPSLFEICENGVKAFSYEATSKKADPHFFSQHTLLELSSWDDFSLENTGRLTHPMAYNATSDKYEAITWPEAFQQIAAELQALEHPDQAIFYTSGRTSNEAAFLYQLLGRTFGTNNFPDCSNLCHESSGVGMIESIGIGKGTVSIDDFHKAEAIFILGQNPGTNHPRMLAELEKASRRGATIVSFNPLKEAGLLKFTHPQDPLAMVLNQKTNISTHYLQPRIGGDMATLRAMAKIILARQDLEGDIVDSAFIQEHCSEYEKYRACVAEESWEDLLEQSGLLREQIEEVTQVYIESKSVIICWAMGITQHRHGVASVQEIINLLLLKGNIGRPGAGACPIRGHSNVQGDRTVGITEYPEESFLGKLDKAFNIHAPREHGLGAVQAIKAMHLETAKFFFGLGGNFAAATPDTSYTYEALKKCSMTVHVSTHLNRSHVIHGKKALILPCLGRTEMDHQASGPQFITVEDSMSRVHASKGVHRPASPALKSEPAIVAELALRLFPHSHIPWQAMCDDYAIIRSKMEAVLPHFENYQQRVAKPKGFYLPNSAGLRQWKTLTKKARFMSNTLPQIKIEPGHLRLMTMRSHNQYNTTIYNHHDRYRGIENERCVILLNGEDIAERGLKEGQRVNIKSHAKDGIERMVKDFMIIVYNIPRGNAATYFPEANPLIGIDEIADRSHTPMSKFIEISLIA